MLKEIQRLAEELGNDVNKVASELKRIQSVKCRLKKMKFKATYEEEMNKVLAYEQALKEVRNLLEPKEKNVPDFTQEDVDLLDYDEVVKAIRSIQSKKTLSKYLSEIEGDNDEYRNAVRVEKMLLERRKEVRPVDESYIRKSDLMVVIETIESAGEIDTERIIEMLKDLM